MGDVEVDGELRGAGVAVLCTAVKMWTMDGEEVYQMSIRSLFYISISALQKWDGN